MGGDRCLFPWSKDDEMQLLKLERKMWHHRFGRVYVYVHIYKLIMYIYISNYIPKYSNLG